MTKKQGKIPQPYSIWIILLILLVISGMLMLKHQYIPLFILWCVSISLFAIFMLMTGTILAPRYLQKRLLRFLHEQGGHVEYMRILDVFAFQYTSIAQEEREHVAQVISEQLQLLEKKGMIAIKDGVVHKRS